ncbi:MAG: bifunctional metallophosphatase/5'-nucleotidase [Bradymonadaceae bacterium]|nr:bifunctional metallophosphatase/5'-nucleotidase [Lujinxingiaceae bacterium]
MLSTRRFVIALLATLTLVACSSGPEVVAEVEEPTPPPPAPVQVSLLAFNDFHGHIEGPSGTVTVDGEKVNAGGAAYLAAHIAAFKAENRNTVVVAAGDLVGASPLASALFNDEPTIEALGMAGLEIAAVGNHEFDHGVDELLRLQNGGCHPTRGCTEGRSFAGASFRYLAANVTYKESGQTMFPAVEIREFDGVKIAFIGLTLEKTPDIVVPTGITTVDFANEITTINALVPGLRAQGIEAIVVLIHEGGFPTVGADDINGCPDISGPIVAIAKGVDDAVDVIVSGHTHQPYICEIGGKLVTSSQSYGRLLTHIALVLDPTTGDVVKRSAKQQVIHHDITENARLAEHVATYVELSAPLASRPVAKIKADLLRQNNEAGESVLGRIIADAQLAATAPADRGRAVIAFMNPGGIREALLFAPPNAEKGIVTYSQMYTVQPFGNNLITMTLTGAQIHRLLEQQWQEQDRVRILQVSKGFTYNWNPDKEAGERVDPKSIKLAGKVLDPAKDYRVTVNNFLANGGDAFTVLTEGTNLLGGPLDLDVLVTYFQKNSPVKAPAEARVKISKK